MNSIIVDIKNMRIYDKIGIQLKSIF